MKQNENSPFLEITHSILQQFPFCMTDDRFNTSILHLIWLYSEADDLKTFDFLLSTENYIFLINNVQPVE